MMSCRSSVRFHAAWPFGLTQKIIPFLLSMTARPRLPKPCCDGQSGLVPIRSGWPILMIRNGLTHVILDGRAHPPCDGVQGPVLSPDSRHVAWLAILNGQWHVVVGGTVVQQSLDGIFPGPEFRTDSRLDAIPYRGLGP